MRPWFWPSIDSVSAWVAAGENEQYDPRNYLHDEPRRLLQRLIRTVSVEDSVLDLGCNCGSDLNILYSLGFRGLRGVDASKAGLELFLTEYLATFKCAEPSHALFQEFFLQEPDESVDYIHSNGATFELRFPASPSLGQIELS